MSSRSMRRRTTSALAAPAATTHNAAHAYVRARITTGPLAAIAGVDLEYVGYGIVLLFVVTWALAVTIWKVGRIDERWSAHLSRSGG